MANPWHDVNDPAALLSYDIVGSTAPAEIGPTEEDVKERSADLEIFSADEWEQGPDGYEFNKTCYLTVQVNFLSELWRSARIHGSLFVTHDGSTEDLKKVVEGVVARDADSDSGSVRLEIPLYYHSGYYDKGCVGSCSYELRSITSSFCRNTLNSAALEMPVPGITSEETTLEVAIEDLPDLTPQDIFVLNVPALKKTWRKPLSDTKPGTPRVISFEGLRTGNLECSLHVEDRQERMIATILDNEMLTLNNDKTGDNP